MKPLLTFEEIITQSEGLHLYGKLVIQLNKDFNRQMDRIEGFWGHRIEASEQGE